MPSKELPACGGTPVETDVHVELVMHIPVQSPEDLDFDSTAFVILLGAYEGSRSPSTRASSASGWMDRSDPKQVRAAERATKRALLDAQRNRASQVQVEHLRQRAKELRAVQRAANAAVHAASPEGQVRLRRTSVSAEERAQGYRWQDRRGYLANEKRAIERLTVEEPRRRRMGSL